MPTGNGRKLGRTVATGVALSLLAGCGGAGVNTNPNASSLSSGAASRNGDRSVSEASQKAEAERGRLGIFLSVAGTIAGYDRFWTDIRKIELLDSEEKSVTVYEGDAVVTDLMQLTDARSPRFALVGVAVAPTDKSYARARITFGKAFTLLPSGAEATQAVPVSDAVGRDAADNPQMTVPLERPRDFGNGKQNLVLAFDLTKTVLKDGRITPAVKEGKTDGLADNNRQIPTDFIGVISDLHFGEKDATFTLGIGLNRSVTVVATDGTSYANATATPNPQLKEGYKIVARGNIAPDTKRVAARQIEIFGETAPPADLAIVRGRAQSADAKNRVVTVAPEQAANLTPTARAVTVQLTADAVLRGSGGLLLTADQFFESLKAKGARLSLAGAYEPVTATFRATRARLTDSDNLPAIAAAVEGTPRDVNAADGKIRVTDLTGWQGMLARAEGKGVPAVTSPATLYFDEKGDPITAGGFYDALKNADHAVRIVGLYANGLLGATRVTLLPPAPRAEPKTADSGNATTAVDARAARKTGETSGEGDASDRAKATEEKPANPEKEKPADPAPDAEKKPGDAKPAPVSETGK